MDVHGEASHAQEKKPIANGAFISAQNQQKWQTFHLFPAKRFSLHLLPAIRTKVGGGNELGNQVQEKSIWVPMYIQTHSNTT